MSLRKKLMVWGAFCVMGLIFAGCTEESFDSVVEVEDSSSEGLGDGSGDSSISSVHMVKNNVGDAILDLFSSSDDATTGSSGSDGSGSSGAESSSSSGFESVTVPGASSSGSGTGTGSGTGSGSGSSYSIGSGSSRSRVGGSDYVYHDPYADEDDSGFDPGTKQYEDEDDSFVDDPELGDDPVFDDEDETPTEQEDEDKEEAAKEEEQEAPVQETKPAEETPAVKEQEVVKEEPVVVPEPEPEPAPEAPAETPVEPEPEIVEEVSYDVELTMLIMNDSGARYGMIAFINPYTKEQVNVGALGSGEMFVFTMNWPSKEKHFAIAVYDESGNLIKNDSIDFHNITAGCAIRIVSGGDFVVVIE